jgi:C4-dicarboxylate transporter DctM subunit
MVAYKGMFIIFICKEGFFPGGKMQISIINLAIGLCTPPVGENQYIVSAIADIPFEQEVKASFPFVMVAFLGLFIITYIPDIVMFLPNLLGY